MERQDWRQQIVDATRREGWSTGGANRVVKVRPLFLAGGEPCLPPADGKLGGFITVARALHGLTPGEMERALGLEDRSLANGAVIYSFTRVPMAHEYEYELTAVYPNGLAFTFMSDPKYPTGSEKIHQWRMKDGFGLPIAAGREFRLLPGQRFAG